MIAAPGQAIARDFELGDRRLYCSGNSMDVRISNNKLTLKIGTLDPFIEQYARVRVIDGAGFLQLGFVRAGKDLKPGTADDTSYFIDLYDVDCIIY
jgi:hypothetical protein